ncbi:hypothetical protein BDV39DRAFT_209629 [Aspergillus sergii]|uniref:Uncharacterized protein n=1 Tax=Aspergillus sergii TaxID=1034303 RepID=A0A5N6WPU3_9EURO|nr:hypothetical protein BDV39DRAFT_209629 [Aspergillus sergii]
MIKECGHSHSFDSSHSQDVDSHLESALRRIQMSKRTTYVLREYQDEPRDIKNVTQIIEDEEALQTEAIKAQILAIGTLSQNLHDDLRRLGRSTSPLHDDSLTSLSGG